MFLNLIAFFAVPALALVTPPPPPQDQPAPQLVDIAIVLTGIFLVAVEFLLFARQRRQQALVPFAVYSGAMEETTPTHSHNQLSVQKNESIALEQDSMHQAQTALPSKDEDATPRRNKRRRKADRLSDRRGQGEQDSLDNEQG